MHGCTYDTARNLLVSERDEELLKMILNKYKALEQECDLVVCAGTDFTTTAAALEFDFNARVANNLGCSVVAVANGHAREPDEIVGAVQGLLQSLGERKCDILALIANRVSEPFVDIVADHLSRIMPAGTPSYVLPTIPILENPTVGEIATTLGAERLGGQDASFNRDVKSFKVAAMELPNFLEHLEEGCLIVTAGDRSDIIIGSLLADISSTYPNIAGLLLTGGIDPANPVKRLIGGFGNLPVPVISVPTDTYQTAMRVSTIEGVLSPENPRKIAAALGIVEARMDADEFIGHLSAARPDRMTPLMFEYEIIRRAKAFRKNIVLPEGTEDRILRAAEIIRMRNVVAVTLLGNAAEIRHKAAALGVSLDGLTVIDPQNASRRQVYADAYFEQRKHRGISPQMAFDAMADVSYFGTMMVQFGDADGMVSGAVHTTKHTIRPALEIIRTRPGCTIVSSVFFMCMADRILVYGDCAINPDPSADQLADIAISSADTAQAFGIEPRIAMLSYSSGT
jgi:phosphate acetyltransferase